MMNPLDALYDQMLRAADNGNFPDGVRPKRGCKTCHGNTGLVRKVTGHDDDGKELTAQEACPCIRRQIIASYHRELKGGSTPSAPSNNGKKKRLPAKKELERLDRLEDTLKSRQSKLDKFEEQLAARREDVVSAGGLGEEQEECRAQINRATVHLERIRIFREEQEKFIAELRKNDVRLVQAQSELRTEIKALEAEDSRLAAAMETEREKRAEGIGKLAHTVQAKKRDRDKTLRRVNDLRRRLDMEELSP